MMYYVGQLCGLLATAFCLVTPLFRKKWQMLLATAAANVFFGLNLLFLGQAGSGLVVHCVAIVQASVALLHLKRNTGVSKRENILFLAAYVGLGLLGFRRLLDLMPVTGAVFNMLATFQRDEQKTRYLLLINAAIYFSYFFLIGSTSMLAELCALITTVLSILRYRSAMQRK